MSPVLLMALLLKLYVDGRPISAMVQLNKIPAMLTTSFLAFGSEDGDSAHPAATAGRYFHGLIDEVSIYNLALSAEEVAAIYGAGDKGKCTGVPLTIFSSSLTFKLGTAADDDTFDLRATGTNGPGSDGIDPFTEDIGIRFGTFSIVLAGGSFNGKKPFKGTINGVAINASISVNGGRFDLRVSGSGANLSGVVGSPFSLEVVIGNNGAVTPLSDVQITGSAP
jgi:hypothetical protein